MIIAATGHRPNKLGGYGSAPAAKLRALAFAYFEREAPAKVISGMALGWDTAVAFAALELKIPLLAAVPFVGQESRWPAFSRATYQLILRQAEVHVVSPGSYHPYQMQIRNCWMVDRCDKLVALWNGSPGGTANCIAYAKQKHREIDNLWPPAKNQP